MAAVIAFAAAPAAATTVTAFKGKEVRYRVTAARGFERVTFSGTPAANCTTTGVCGKQGTVSYSFGGTPTKSKASLIVDKGRVTSGRATFQTHGVTKSRLTSTNSAPCSDKRSHRNDYFLFVGKSSKRVEFDFRSGTGSPDYLATKCQTPTEVSLIDSNAVPTATFSATGLNHASDNFSLKGSRNFVISGYEGTVSWNLRYSITQTG
jgi:hypothetical protein